MWSLVVDGVPGTPEGVLRRRAGSVVTGRHSSGVSHSSGDFSGVSTQSINRVRRRVNYVRGEIIASVLLHGHADTMRADTMRPALVLALSTIYAAAVHPKGLQSVRAAACGRRAGRVPRRSDKLPPRVRI